MTRPLTAIGAGAAPVIYCLFQLFRRELPRRTKTAYIIIAAISWAPFIFFYAYFNFRATGSWTTTGYEFIYGDDQVPRFKYHSVYTGLFNLWGMLRGVNSQFFTAALPALALPGLLLLLRPISGREWALLLSSIGLCMAYSAYPYVSGAYGPRFLFELAPSVVVFNGAALCSLYDIALKLADKYYPASSPSIRASD